MQYGPLELRRREGGGGLHCWQTLHPSEFEVRGANYLRDGKKLPSDQVRGPLLRSPSPSFCNPNPHP